MRKAFCALLLSCLLLFGCQTLPQGQAVGATPAPTAEPTPVPTETPVPPQPIEKHTIEEVITPTPTVPPTPSPTPSPTPTPTPEPTPLGLLPWTMGDLFSFDETIDREYEYKSNKLSITMTRYSDTQRTGKTLVYFVADIFIQDINSFRRAQCAQNFDMGTPKSINMLASEANAILAMSGDYCHNKKPALVVINGELVHDLEPFRYDICVLYQSGEMEMISAKEIDRDKILSGAPWQTWNFGPSLLDEDGNPLKTFNLPDDINDRNPRAVLGYYYPGHYCFVLVEGRQNGYSIGLTIPETAELMHDLGCTAAYNLDGGISAQITWHDTRVNHPGKNRSIRDILYISEP